MAFDSAAPYRLKHHLRVVTAASLFDGHDAAINVMRRIMQASGAEVIHLGHNRSAREIVECAIEEDAQAIAITSYQGGHLEYFRYMHDLLRERGADIRLFGGGGGTILPSEIEELHAYGIERIYSPDDGRSLGLQGMIDDLLRRADFQTVEGGFEDDLSALDDGDARKLARLITRAETLPKQLDALRGAVRSRIPDTAAPVLGITGTGGAGKSSLIDELIRRFLHDHADKRLAIISIDPTRRRSGGALLGDRIRMNALADERVFMRSLATRQSNLSMSAHVGDAVAICRAAGFDLVIVETSGIGQSDTEIAEHADVSLYVMTSEYGAATQLEKIDMLDFADVVAINKFDKRGSEDALKDVRKQVQRNRGAFEVSPDTMAVYGTIASRFDDPGTDRLYSELMRRVEGVRPHGFTKGRFVAKDGEVRAPRIIPGERNRYLAEIAEAAERHEAWVARQCDLARRLWRVAGTLEELERPAPGEDSAPILDGDTAEVLRARREALTNALDGACLKALTDWPEVAERYRSDTYSFQVRDRTIELPLTTKSLAGTRIPKVALPRHEDWGELLRWLLRENLPGSFPYTAGVFPLKRDGEDPARMFAGEGGPERTNRRFHYVSTGLPAKRLSTAFDSVTLYGEDPDLRPDIYGKIGNSGVSIATVDDAKKLYSGFDLADPSTSVSMTINGPAPMLLAFFLNAAIDQAVEKHLKAEGQMEAVDAKIEAKYAKLDQPRPRYSGELPEGNDGLGLALLGVSGDEVLDAETYAKIAADTLAKVRGTVQADILKEDQAQNTCIFSTEFALRMMADVQAWFIDRGVRNFYSVSISGYHIAEAGANPITQLAFTLANGFTYVESYLARGMGIDAFAPNLSFFFSNGMDPEYSVIGRVARRVWSRAMREVYGANGRSQKLKYHIQTSGRSLHAQEIAFNDIRTTLQALCALYDNCNSLHTNAYDEAITTPTEESVRRALAIQLVINKEHGLAKNENPLQGSFIIEEMTDLVEEAVYTEFTRISERGGVLGAMERMYQRGKIQDESLHYESLKHSGELPIIGVNTFLSSEGSPTLTPGEVIRATEDEKQYALDSLAAFHARNAARCPAALDALATVALDGGNVFGALMETVKSASLGQISNTLYHVGGQYRRNM